MQIQAKPPTVENPPEQFTGDAWFDVIATRQHEDQRMVVGLVRFAPDARTAWHSHAKGILHVIHGVALMQSRGGNIIALHPGQTVYTPRKFGDKGLDVALISGSQDRVDALDTDLTSAMGRAARPAAQRGHAPPAERSEAA